MRRSFVPSLILGVILLSLSSCGSCNQAMRESPLPYVAYDDLPLNEDSEEIIPKSKLPTSPPTFGGRMGPQAISLFSAEENPCEGSKFDIEDEYAANWNNVVSQFRLDLGYKDFHKRSEIEDEYAADWMKLFPQFSLDSENEHTCEELESDTEKVYSEDWTNLVSLVPQEFRLDLGNKSPRKRSKIEDDYAGNWNNVVPQIAGSDADESDCQDMTGIPGKESESEIEDEKLKFSIGENYEKNASKWRLLTPLPHAWTHLTRGFTNGSASLPDIRFENAQENLRPPRKRRSKRKKKLNTGQESPTHSQEQANKP